MQLGNIDERGSSPREGAASAETSGTDNLEGSSPLSLGTDPLGPTFPRTLDLRGGGVCPGLCITPQGSGEGHEGGEQQRRAEEAAGEGLAQEGHVEAVEPSPGQVASSLYHLPGRPQKQALCLQGLCTCVLHELLDLGKCSPW